VFKSWDKLLDLNKVAGVKRAEEDAIAEGQRLDREAEAKAKADAEMGIVPGTVGATVAWVSLILIYLYGRPSPVYINSFIE